MNDFFNNEQQASTGSNVDYSDYLPIAVCTINRDGILTKYNKAFKDLFKISDTTNLNWRDIFEINISEANLPFDIEKMQDNVPFCLKINPEEKIIVSIQKREIFDEVNFTSQTIIYFTNLTSVIPDLDNYKSEIFYSKMIDEIEDYAIISLDKKGNIVNWNKGAKKIKGYDFEEIVGKNISCFYSAEDQCNRLPQKVLNDAKKNGKSIFEGWRLRKDGSQFWGSITLTSIKDHKDQLIGFSKITKDLTAQKLADDKVLAYAHNVELQNRQLEEFAYVASHDLQDPLRKIQLFASILEKNLDNKETLLRTSQKISQSANRMSNLIRDILRYSVISNSDFDRSEVDLNLTLTEVRENLEVMIEEKQANIEITTLPILTGIPIQLHQLFYNLVSNALKFNNKIPNIIISSEPFIAENHLKINPIIPNQEYYVINVKDNGIGFEQQYADKIFKVFHRLGDKTSGSGIGLALCKKIVENHQGFIEVESALNQGTTFKIILPKNQ